MRINTTGVDIIFEYDQYSIIKDNQFLTSVKSKELAVGLALNKEYINNLMLQENNNLYYLKVAA
jgi:hypothetical protein